MKLLAAFLTAAVVFTAPLPAAATKGPEPLKIAQGEPVALTDHLVPGKTVIFDFTSKYCGPCQMYNEPLHDLHAKRDDVVVVKVDINRPDHKGIDWQSPVARQYDLHSIPHFKVYSPEGKLVAEDKMVIGADGQPDRAASSRAGREMVDGMINQLGH